MVKLQEINRTDGTTVNSVNIPKNIIEESGLVKGDKLEVKTFEKGIIIINKVIGERL